MSTMSSLTTYMTSLVLLSNLTGNVTGEVVVMSLDEGCDNSFTRLDLHESVTVKTRTWPKEAFPAQVNSSCTVEFMTANEDQGICFETNHMSFITGQDNVKIKFYTSKYGPEKIIDRFHFDGLRKWCTHQPLVTMEIMTTEYLENQAAEFFFNFNVKNVSREELPREFVMDSYKHCNRTHAIKAGDSIELLSQRYPASHALPASCQLTLETSGGEEFEQLCVEVAEYRNRHNCQGTLTVEGFHADYWVETQHLGCNDDPDQTLGRASQTLCSGNKKLVFNLVRTNSTDTGMVFRAKVKNMWHPHWQEMSSIEEQLAGLSFVKGLTFFIAAFDSLVGILAAVLATMIRHPGGFWKEWAESMGTGGKGEAVHYEVSYPEVSCSKDEEAPEAKAY